MQFIYDDGGRKAAGYQGSANDCATRSIAICTGKPYQEVYDAINDAAQGERRGKLKKGISSARTGVYKQTTRKYLASLGWIWHPTMQIGSGCTVHLTDGELPGGRIIVKVSKHLVAVIDGIIHDTHDPQREEHWSKPNDGTPLRRGQWINEGNGMVCWIERRCVYGYFTSPETA